MLKRKYCAGLLGNRSMSSEITLAELNKRLQPDAVQAYLRSRGWVDDGSESPSARVYVKKGVSGAEVIVPTRTAAPDFHKLTLVLVKQLARIEKCSEQAILRDLSFAGYDVLRLRIVGADDGALSLGTLISTVREARATIVAAASATASKAPRANYAGRQSEKVSAFIDKVRMGQTERGSFVVPLLIPFAFDVQEEPSIAREWFGRRVSRKLTSSFQAIETALAQSDGTDDMSAFSSATASGVSANLCQALGRLVEATGKVELGVRWAISEPEDIGPTSFTLTDTSAPTLFRAAAKLAETDPPPPEPVVGHVTKLGEDTAIVSAWISGGLKSVTVAIPEHHRGVFADAWNGRLPVYLEGDLTYEGRKIKLGSLRTVGVAPAEEG